jgi:hypothetical protein
MIFSLSLFFFMLSMSSLSKNAFMFFGSAVDVTAL